MKIEQVPQDDSSTYSGHKKVVYAVDDSGHYQSVKTSGWEVEAFATQMAVDDLNEQTQEAFDQVQAGEKSTLAYHMLKARLDLIALQQATGFFRWQIRRHLKPKVFARLSDKKLEIYSQTLGISIQALKTLPEHP